MDICRLCGLEAKLIKSHFMPKSAYAHLRSETESPIKINGKSSTAAHTDSQVTRKLLCSRCENLFSAKGERIMGTLWNTKNGFPLLELLERSAYHGRKEGETYYDGRKVSQTIRNALFYFAVSIVWRAQVWDWGQDGDPYGGALGDLYEKKFREFLLNGDDLPYTYLTVELNTNPKFSSLMFFPHSYCSDGLKIHRFALLGITFYLCVGKLASPAFKALFSHFESNLLLCSKDIDTTPMMITLAESYKSVTPKGKLARGRSVSK